MTMTADIQTAADISLLVRQFYLKVRSDEFLSLVFNQVIHTAEWEPHLQKMCDFWETILLHNRRYTGDPLIKHLPLAVTPVHFQRWLMLFETTLDSLFAGPVAAEAKQRAGTIAKLIMHAKQIPLS